MNPNYTPQPGQTPQPPYGGGQPYQPPTAPYGPPPGQPQAYGQPSSYNQQPQPPYGQQPPVRNGPPSPYGQQYSGQYNNLPYRAIPYQPPPNHKPVASKRLILISAGLLTVFLIGVAMANFGSDTPSAPRTTVEQAADPALADISSRPDGILDLSKKITVESSLKAQSIKAKTKEQINLSSGFSFLIRATGTYDSPNTPPAAGKKFVIVQVVTGNRAAAGSDTTDDISVSYLDFKLQAKDNSLISGHPSTQQIPNNILASPSALKPGEQVEGRILYEVDAAATEAAIVHKETYRKTSDGSSFTVEGIIAISLR